MWRPLLCYSGSNIVSSSGANIASSSPRLEACPCVNVKLIIVFDLSVYLTEICLRLSICGCQKYDGWVMCLICLCLCLLVLCFGFMVGIVFWLVLCFDWYCVLVGIVFWLVLCFGWYCIFVGILSLCLGSVSWRVRIVSLYCFKKVPRIKLLIVPRLISCLLCQSYQL